MSEDTAALSLTELRMRRDTARKMARCNRFTDYERAQIVAALERQIATVVSPEASKTVGNLLAEFRGY